MIWKTKENSTIGEKIHYMILENRPALYVLPKKVIIRNTLSFLHILVP